MYCGPGFPLASRGKMMWDGAVNIHVVEARCELTGTLYALDAMLVLRIYALVSTKRSERVCTEGQPYAMLYRASGDTFSPW